MNYFENAISPETPVYAFIIDIIWQTFDVIIDEVKRLC